jgi:oligosaccharide reducing-end xylanase
MKTNRTALVNALFSLLVFLAADSVDGVAQTLQHPASGRLPATLPQGAYFTGAYPNLFSELLGFSRAEVDERVDAAFRQLFYGNDSTERVYYPVGKDMAYIIDVGNNDVRTEGMSYGMMIAVQLNKREEFDRLWKWARLHMYIPQGAHKGYFGWHCKTDGTLLDSTAASDGEEWFVMSLLFASARWADKGGATYRAEANAILTTMLHKEEEPGHGNVTNMFDAKSKLVAFVPDAHASFFTDPSYQLPHYYELWGRWADRDNTFWCGAAKASRELLQRAAHPTTGLSPDYAGFDGKPVPGWRGEHADFRFDAWRVGMNVAIDWLWFRKDSRDVELANRLLGFFGERGIATYGNQFTLEGKELANDHSAGLVGMNAVAGIAATTGIRDAFVREFWQTPIPHGHYRYYDGMLYMLALLQLSGNFRIYDPSGHTISTCTE